MNKSVYLAGPIAGLTYDDCTDWRDIAKLALSQHGIEALSPMRGKKFLRNLGRHMTNRGHEQHPLSSSRGIMTRDHFDATRCDVMIVNLLGAQQVSVGTTMELAWAFDRRTPVVAIIEADGSNIHEHAMLSQTLDFRVASVLEAIDTVKAILTP